MRKSVELDGGLAQARVDYGRCLVEQNQPQAAVAQLRKAIELAPKSAAAYYQLVRALQRAGDEAAAQDALRQYEKLREP